MADKKRMVTPVINHLDAPTNWRITIFPERVKKGDRPKKAFYDLLYRLIFIIPLKRVFFKVDVLLYKKE
jgi:hypothetical protein